MGKKVEMSPWVPGPKHGWKVIHKIRQDADADVVEEFYAERSFYVGAAFYVATCIAGWWWQTALDGWARGALLAFTIMLTTYLLAMAGALLLFHWFGRFIRNV